MARSLLFPFIIILFVTQVRCTTMEKLEPSTAPGRYPASGANLNTDNSDEFSFLRELGISGRILSEQEFNEQLTGSNYISLNKMRPVQLPGFVIESFPNEEELNLEALKKISNGTAGPTRYSGTFLLEPEVRRMIREFIKEKQFFIVSKSVCDEKGVTLGKSHETLLSWEKAFGFVPNGAIIISHCAGPQTALHEIFHLFQFNWKKDSEAPISFQDLGRELRRLTGNQDQKAIGSILFPFIEAQASLYAIREMRQTYSNFPHPSYNSSETNMLDYYWMNYDGMLFGVKDVVIAENRAQRIQEVMDFYEKFFPLDKGTLYTGPLGRNRKYCYYNAKDKWLFKDYGDLTVRKNSLPAIPWDHMESYPIAPCSQKVIEFYEAR